MSQVGHQYAPGVSAKEDHILGVPFWKTRLKLVHRGNRVRCVWVLGLFGSRQDSLDGERIVKLAGPLDVTRSMPETSREMEETDHLPGSVWSFGIRV